MFGGGPPGNTEFMTPDATLQGCVCLPSVEVRRKIKTAAKAELFMNKI